MKTGWGGFYKKNLMKWIANNMKTFTLYLIWFYFKELYLFSQKGKKKTQLIHCPSDEIHSYEEKTNMQRTLQKKTSNHYFQINMLLINISGWRTCIIQGQSKNLNTEYLVLMVMGIQNHINLEIHCFNHSQPCTHYYKKCIIFFFFLMCWYTCCVNGL